MKTFGLLLNMHDEGRTQMIKYRWVTLENITRWLIDGTVTEINFTGDAFVADDLEPSGWYGMKISKEFDGKAMIFGDWGRGIIDTDPLLYDGVMNAIKRFFKREFNREIYHDTYICCEAKGLPMTDKYMDPDGMWVVEFNGDKIFDCIDTENEAENFRLALEQAYEFGREMGK